MSFRIADMPDNTHRTDSEDPIVILDSLSGGSIAVVGSPAWKDLRKAIKKLKKKHIRSNQRITELERELKEALWAQKETSNGGCMMSHDDIQDIKNLLAIERERKLREAFSELVYWARDIAGDCDDPEQRKQEDEMMGRMSALLAELDKESKDER